MNQALRDAQAAKSGLLHNVGGKQSTSKIIRKAFPKEDAFLADMADATKASLIVSEDRGRARKGAQKRGLPVAPVRTDWGTVHVCSVSEALKLAAAADNRAS